MVKEAKFRLVIEMKNKNMQTHLHVAQALRELAAQFEYSCEHFPCGPIMDTKNEESVGHYWVSLEEN